MEDVQINKAIAIKYLVFLGEFVEDLLTKNSPVAPDDLRRLFNEHTLFLRRVDESRWVSDDFKREVHELAGDPLIFGKGALSTLGRVVETLEEGPHRNDRTSYGPLGPNIIQALSGYQDRVRSLLQRIETFRFWQ